jgi:feruloyl esterase
MLRPLSALLLCSAAGFAADCAALAKLALPHTTIAEAAAVPAGDFKSQKNLPAFCRVAGAIAPSADSDIRFEVWLPAAGWNGKFLGVGNGGYAGSISFGGMAEAIRSGYATASTDTGHTAKGGVDASWALGHPEKVIDFGHRAIHEMTVKGKAITEAFYGAAPKKSYFSSCSNGGRQALMEAQRYPADYDGIIAGAPANDWVHLMTNAARIMHATQSPESYIPAAKLPAIQAAALAACDRNDAVPDGVVENPGQCRFDPSALLCQGVENDQCLTAPQVQSLRAIYAGLRDGKGKQVYPGYALSGEAEPGGWGAWITGPAPEKSALFAFSTNFFKYMVYGDEDWDYRKFDLARDLAAARKTAVHLSAVNPDLRAFQARGGKLILYHGWCDAAIPGQAAIDYYQSVVRKMGAKRAGQFVRLFMAPGVQHCGGGAGPNTFGQGSAPKGDPAQSIAAAMLAWVEEGKAPEQIVAMRKGRTRPLCAYPKTARYKGSGSTDDAANFECAQ